MKAVIDTNILMSGTFWGGPTAKVLDAYLKDKFEWIVSTEILEEYWRVLNELLRKYQAPTQVVEFFQTLSLAATIVSPVSFGTQVCSDPDDDKFLEAAVAGAAGFIVSGDKALLKTDGFHGIRVLKPAEFLKKL